MDNNWSSQNLETEPPGEYNELPVNTLLSREGPSYYSWTIDQIQNNLGKDCGPTRDMASVTLSGTSSQKTVDEVWKYIKEKEEHAKLNNRGRNISQIQRQQTLRDIALEAKGKYNNNVGYIHGSSSLLSSNPNTSCYDFTYQQHQQQQQQLQQPKPQGYGNGTQTGFSSGQVNSHGLRSGFMGMRDQCLQEKNINLVPSVDTSSLIKDRKNRNGMAVENTRIEKARRRKIKNRESAERSRARKQAQIMELEAEVEKLREENQELLRKQEMINLQERPERQLRRTRSDIK